MPSEKGRKKCGYYYTLANYQHKQTQRRRISQYPFHVGKAPFSVYYILFFPFKPCYNAKKTEGDEYVCYEFGGANGFGKLLPQGKANCERQGAKQREKVYKRGVGFFA
jgi:hypothetical protein